MNRNNQEEIQTITSLVVLVGVITFFCGMNFVWWAWHTVPPTWDEANYLLTTEQLFQSLRSFNFQVFWNSYIGALFGAKAPLLSFMLIPSYLLLGSGKVALSIAMTVLVGAFCWVCYKMAFGLTKDRYLSVVAVVITSTMPLVYGLSRALLVEYGLAMFVCIWVWLQERSNHFNRFGFNTLLGIVLGLGVLMKITFLVFIFAPIVWGIANYFLQNGLDRNSGKRLVASGFWIGIVGGCILATWYLPNENYKTVIGHALAASGHKEYAYGGGNLTFWEMLSRYGRDFIVNGLSVYWTGLTLGLISLTAIKYYRRVSSRGLNVPLKYGVGWLLFLWPSVMLILSSTTTVKDLRYFLPIFPVIGTGIAVLLFDHLRERYVSRVVLLVLLLPPLVFFMFNSLPFKDTVVLGSQDWRIVAPSLGYAMRPVKEYWPNEEIISAIWKDAQSYFIETKQIFVLVVADAAHFNQHTLNYTAIHLGLNSNYPEAAAESSLQQSGQMLQMSAVLTNREMTDERWEKVKEWMLQAKYLITKTGNQGPSFTTVKNLEIHKLLESSALPYTRWASFDLPDNSQCIIYRRRKAPVSVVDIRKIVTRQTSIVAWGVDAIGHDIVKLKIWRPYKQGFLVVDESEEFPVVKGGNSFTLREPMLVLPGEYLGLLVGGGGVKSGPSDGPVFHQQYILNGDIANDQVGAGWLEPQPYAFHAEFEDQLVQAKTVSSSWGTANSPITFIDMSKQVVRTGSITAWVVHAASEEELRLKVWRKVTETSWAVVGESQKILVKVGKNRYKIDPPISVLMGDYLGFYTSWHSPNDIGNVVPFSVIAEATDSKTGGSFYVNEAGDIRGTVSVDKLVPDTQNFKFYVFYEE